MSHSVREAAIESLTNWWSDMGVDVDATEVSALLQQAAPSRSEPGSMPTSQRRPEKRKPRTLEDRIAEAENLARSSNTLPELKTAIESYDGCPLKEGATKTVIYDGVEGAPVMVIGEGAGGTEDQVGLPFVGKAGKLLDKMLAAIELDRKNNAFITNVTYWRPPGNRNPEPDELAVCRPFVDRMIELAAPKIILAVGGVSAKSLLRTSTGIMRLRGKWVDYETPGGFSCPLMPTFHPAYLLRRPQDKSRAWRDLLAAKARLADTLS
ncbi:MAG: uracil-DNA glycosylase [Pseudomonadota bacterium]